MSKTSLSIILLLAAAFFCGPVAHAHQRISPVYPKEAAENCIEGFVYFRFTVNEEGWPRDFEVLESKPSGIFDDAVQSAVVRWRYDPARSGDEVRETLEFHIKDECTPSPTHNNAFNPDTGKAGAG